MTFVHFPMGSKDSWTAYKDGLEIDAIGSAHSLESVTLSAPLSENRLHVGTMIAALFSVLTPEWTDGAEWAGKNLEAAHSREVTTTVDGKRVSLKVTMGLLYLTVKMR